MIPIALRVIRPLAGVLAIGFAASACEYLKQGSPAEPSSQPGPPAAGGAGGSTSYIGTWSSVVAGAQAVSTRACSKFEWIVTSQTTESIAGTFKATCLDAFTITGNAEGRLASPTAIDMAVSGSAKVAGINCAFSLSGSGTYEGEAIRVPYSGSTCLGPVSGTETLRRSDIPGLPGPAPPAPPAQPAPEPPPTPMPSPSVPCALGNGPRIVECVSETFAEYRRPVGSLSERQANMSFLRDRIIEAGKCSGLDLGWNLKRGGPDLSIDFLAERRPGGDMGIDIGADYDNIGATLRLQWHEAGFGATFKPYPNPTCG